MVYSVAPQEARIWLDSEPDHSYELLYWEPNQPEQIWKSAPTEVIGSNPEPVLLEATALKPGTTYEYAILLDGDPLLLPFRTHWTTPPNPALEPAPVVTFLAASGFHLPDPSLDPFDSRLVPPDTILESMLAQRPDFLLWLGNTQTLRSVDLGGSSGPRLRTVRNRMHPPLRPLLASTLQLGLPGPRDLGPGQPTAHAYAAGEALRNFSQSWFSTPQFRWADVDFFFLDTFRYRQESITGFSPARILGEAQMIDLLHRLRLSTATFKIILSGTPLLHSAAVYPNLAQNHKELNLLLEALRRNPVDGLFFLTGSSPSGEGSLIKRVRPRNYSLYELNLGSLTNAPESSETRPENYLREPGTRTPSPHYAWIRVTGPSARRILEVTLYDDQEEPIWNINFSPDQLSSPQESD